MNLGIFAFVTMSYIVSIGKFDSGKNKYIPYNNANAGGGPHGYYKKFPKLEYKCLYEDVEQRSVKRARVGEVVFGLVVPVNKKPKK
jgi:hypothetical protein